MFITKRPKKKIAVIKTVASNPIEIIEKGSIVTEENIVTEEPKKTTKTATKKDKKTEELVEE